MYRRKTSSQAYKKCRDLVEKGRSELEMGAPRRYISRTWLRKMEILSTCPIDNRELCCPHCVPKFYSNQSKSKSGDRDTKMEVDEMDTAKSGIEERAVVVSVPCWEELTKLYHGGPVVDGENHTCSQCQLPLIQRKEYREISTLDTEALRTAKPEDPYYLIHTDWIRFWKKWATEGAPRPGPICNNCLVEEDGKTPKKGLEKVHDFRGLRKPVWDRFVAVYGGGPPIIRKVVDIYSPPWEQADQSAPPNSTELSTASSISTTSTTSTTSGDSDSRQEMALPDSTSRQSPRESNHESGDSNSR